MTEKIYVASDLGAGSGRVIAGRFDGSRLRFEETNRFENNQTPLPGGLHWDMIALYRNILEGIRRAKALGAEPASIGVDTWGVDYALVDAAGRLTGLPHSYRDPRLDGVMEETCSRLGRRRIYDAVARFRANYLFLVPALADILANKIAQHGPSAEIVLGTPIDWILVGGAPLARRTYERLLSLGIRPLGGYGLTETTSLYSLAPVDDPRPGSAGKCCDGAFGMEAKVSPDGELLLRGPAVLKGYYKEPKRTADVLDSDGWFRTGDIGRIDEDGYVWITGRASRTIVLSSGKKVAPEELEEKILSIPGIHEAVVYGDGAIREIVAEVYAVVSEDTVKRQIDSLNRQLPVHKRIKRVVTRKEPFPRTASGKIQVQNTMPKQQGGAVLPPLPTLPAPKPATLPSFNASLRTWLFWSVLFVSAAVLLFNLASLVIPSLKSNLPTPINELVDGTEILLSVFALLVVCLAFKGRNLMMVYKRRKKK